MKLGDIARERREPYKGDKKGIPIVGLEHLISKELRFSEYDVNTDNTFTKFFHKGQILFGRRRAYLQKAAIAEFDGICSGDITVIESIPGKVEPRLLPFIIQNDKLFDFAISRSAGGLSPRVKWEHLAEYKLDLPPIKEQRVLADKLWAAYDLKEAYKKMIAATDEMVKAQFIEWFGNPFEDNPNKVPLSNLCTINPPKPKRLDDALHVSFIPMERIKEDGTHLGFDNRSIYEVKKGFTYCAENDILFAKITPCMENGKGAIMQGLTNKIGFGSTEFHVLRPIEGVTTSTWLFYLTKLDLFRKDAAQNMTGTSGQKRVPASYLENFMISPPSMAAQKKFIRIVKHADQSKFDLRQAINALDKVIKSLIN